jgi:catechol 2,3-dioxygenase-like lactoylglutathione lyase family enzyme
MRSAILLGIIGSVMSAALVARVPAAAPQPAGVTITRVTLAATNVAAMTRFYNVVFDARLRDAVVGGVTMQRGTLAGLELLLCPNDVAKVDAALNRHMLRIEVNDLDRFVARVRDNGGTVDAPPALSDGIRVMAIRDPDGNTIELAGR